ncbi:MAG: DUF2157 domain-containing protein [Bacteroidia bacterium]
MILNRKQGHFLADTIDQWQQANVITPEDAVRLRNSYSVRPFDWKRLAMYCFWVAIICGVIAVGAILADDWFANLSEASMCVVATGLASLMFYLGLRRRQKYPTKIYSSEALMFVGVLFTSTAIGLLGVLLDNGSGHVGMLFLLGTAIFAGLGLWFPSKLIWVFSLISLGAWFGTESGYVSGWGMYFLGMNYPMRFVAFGAGLTALSLVFRRIPKLAMFFKPTYVMGLLNLFIALWLLSIFGNYGDMHNWYDAGTFELFHWCVLFALVAIGAIVLGLKFDDATSRGFGLVFLFINLYTRYFEYFWNFSHKAIFFLILAVSFGLLGWKAESIWHLEFVRKKDEVSQKESA